MKFRKGDKVRFTKEDAGYKMRHFPGAPEVMTVSRYDDGCYFFDGQTAGAIPGRLQLVSRPYQVGDKVRVLKDSWHMGLTEAIGEVVSIGGNIKDSIRLRFVGWKGGHGPHNNEWNLWAERDEWEHAGDVKLYKPDPVEKTNPFKPGDKVKAKYDSMTYTVAHLGDYDGNNKNEFVTYTDNKGFDHIDSIEPLGTPKFKAGDWVKASKYKKKAGALYLKHMTYGTFSRYDKYDDMIYVLDFQGKEQVMWLSTCEHVDASEIASMPKSPSISPTVTEAQQMHTGKHIVVLMDRYGGLSPSGNPFIHSTRAAAETEALRLAETTKVTPGSSFAVLSMVSKAVPPVPAKATLTVV